MKQEVFDPDTEYNCEAVTVHSSMQGNTLDTMPQDYTPNKHTIWNVGFLWYLHWNLMGVV